MTDIVETPAAPVVPPFPALGSQNFNDEAYAAGAALPGLSAGIRAIGVAAETNALAANERADAADASADDALAQANRAEEQADAAMGYRNTAGSHAAVATTQAGIAAAKAGEAVASAGQASVEKDLAQQAVADAAAQVGLAAAQAVRAEDAAASIAGGPITSLSVHSGLKTGAVTLALSDLGAQATDAQMQDGSLATPLLMSPASVKAAVLTNSRIQRVARTANAQLITADSGRWIDITSGTFTQTFLAPAALGAGWWCYLQNSGTGDITIPSSDGRTNWIMYPGEVRLFQCDGTALRSIVLNAFSKVFTASGNFIKPPGYSLLDGWLWSGGASGSVFSGTGQGNYGPMGGVGGTAERALSRPQDLPDTVTVVIGSGGVAVYNNGAAAANIGGDSYFGSLVAQAARYNAQSGVFTPPICTSPEGRPRVNHGQESNLLGGGSGGRAGYAESDSNYGPDKKRVAGSGGRGMLDALTLATAGTTPAGGGGGCHVVGYWSGAGERGELRIWGVI